MVRRAEPGLDWAWGSAVGAAPVGLCGVERPRAGSQQPQVLPSGRSSGRGLPLSSCSPCSVGLGVPTGAGGPNVTDSQGHRRGAPGTAPLPNLCPLPLEGRRGPASFPTPFLGYLMEFHVGVGLGSSQDSSRLWARAGWAERQESLHRASLGRCVCRGLSPRARCHGQGQDQRWWPGSPGEGVTNR